MHPSTDLLYHKIESVCLFIYLSFKDEEMFTLYSLFIIYNILQEQKIYSSLLNSLLVEIKRKHE